MAAILLTRSSKILGREVGSERLLLDLERESLHVLNPTAALVWDLLARHRSLLDLERGLRQAFEVEPGRDLRADLEALVAELRSRRLVEEVEA